jgi:hypothetical protein
MIRVSPGKLVLLILALLLGAPSAALAAESYDNCTGVIASLPTVINTSGTWCVKQNLATAIASGNAVTVNANNVTIDCNDFKLDGVAAGTGTHTYGIYASGRLETTVRNCNILGFYVGINIVGSGGGGHTVEDNRIEGNTYIGLNVQGDASLVTRNQVFDTGGSTVTASVYGIYTGYSVDVLDNTVSGVMARATSSGYAIGIHSFSNAGGTLRGNRIRQLVRDGNGLVFGIRLLSSSRVTLRENDLGGSASAGSKGLYCQSSTGRAKDNVINGFAVGIDTCSNDGNVIAP